MQIGLTKCRKAKTFSNSHILFQFPNEFHKNTFEYFKYSENQKKYLIFEGGKFGPKIVYINDCCDIK